MSTDTTKPGPVPTNADAASVLAYWLEDAVQLGWPSRNLSAVWFGGGSKLDQSIAVDFGSWVRQALDGGLKSWEHQPLDRLALVILLDQFTRNVFRGQPQAFAGDPRAQSLVLDGIDRGWDRRLPLAGAVFFYMPLMHAENLAQQESCVRCFRALLAGAAPERQQGLQGNLKFAIQHRDIIARFGRFPYRNAALGRTSSPQEENFLRDGPRFGQ
ncbi:MAG: DUF924 family protein [Burkholderiaceae bacterium]